MSAKIESKDVIWRVGEHRPADDECGLMCWYCPGCECTHGVYTIRDPKVPGRLWRVTGGNKKPTVTPSLLVAVPVVVRTSEARLLSDRYYPPEEKTVIRRCHSNVTEGKIVFHSDCSHAFAGQTVDMIPLEEC